MVLFLIFCTNANFDINYFQLDLPLLVNPNLPSPMQGVVMRNRRSEYRKYPQIPSYAIKRGAATKWITFM